MKTTPMLITSVLVFCGTTYAQIGLPAETSSPYDSVLAKRLGADEYGMKRYVMALLKAGPTTIRDSLQRQQIQRRHLQNIKRLAANGTLLIAGPFLDGQSLRGIFLFDVATIEEARTIADTDPAVQAGVLVFELHPWYGSAALVEVPGIHRKIQKTHVVD